MHEFALAQDIIETIERNVTGDLSKIAAIHIEAGQFSGVVVDSLEFGLTIVLQDKNLTDVNIDIVTIPAAAECQCGARYPVADMLDACPTCQSYSRKMTAGTDVIIKSVELTD